MPFTTPLNEFGYAPDDLTVKVSELLVATADTADIAIDDCVPEVLRLLRDRMNMDVVFVSEFTNGRRVFRQVESKPGKAVIQAGDSDPLEDSWCQHVVDGRLPEYIADTAQHPHAAELARQTEIPIGTHISTPVVLRNGEVYGTLCAFSFTPHEHPNPEDLRKLQYVAKLTAQKLEQQRREEQNRPPEPELRLQPRQ
jgi:GAF domain-containing protein